MGVTIAELGEVAETLAGLGEGRHHGPLPTSQAGRWDVTCTREDMDGTCIHRIAAGYVGLHDLCPGCTRHHMELWNGAVDDLHWHPSWIERAGMPAEEVAL